MNSHDRKGWYVQPLTRATVPSVWFAIQLHTIDSADSRRPTLTIKRWGSASVGVIYRTRRGYTAPQIARVSTGDSLREWMCEHSLPDRVNWVIADRVDEVLTLGGWFHAWTAEGISRRIRGPVAGSAATGHSGSGVTILDRFALSPHFACVCYTTLGRQWRWVGQGQYGGLVGGRGAGRGTPDDSGGDGRGVNGRDGAEPNRCAVSRTLQSCADACDWWKAFGSGGWGVSAGGLAVAKLRADPAVKRLCTHRDEDVHALERSAAFGGRASVWFAGQIGEGTGELVGRTDRDGTRHEWRELGPLVHYDVRNMYPALLRDQTYPVKLARVYHDVDPRKLDQLIDVWGVVARVTIRTRRAEYPYRASQGVAYPLGTFTTNLTGPELRRLRADGDVLRCHLVSCYHTAPVFSATASSLLSQLSGARSAGDANAVAALKLLANSLGGKLAQRSGGWSTDRARDKCRQWGEKLEIDAITGEQTRRRWIAGLCEIWREDKSGRGPHTAAFAYLAAYGRLQMRDWRDKLPERAVVSQDTDGLWVLERHTGALASCPNKDDAEPGQLAKVGSVRNARFWGPRHYWTDDGWTLAGFREPVVGDSTHRIWDRRQPLPWSSRTTQTPDFVTEEIRQSEAVLTQPYTNWGNDGWATPRIIYPPKDGSDSAE